MVRKAYTPEQIINRLREAEIMLSQGATLAVIWKILCSGILASNWRKSRGKKPIFRRIFHVFHKNKAYQKGLSAAFSSPKSTFSRSKRPRGIGVGNLYSIESINLLALGRPVAFMVLSKQDALTYSYWNPKIKVSVDLVSSHPVHNRHKIVARWLVTARI